MAVADFLQRINDVAPGAASFSQRSSSAEEVYLCDRTLDGDEKNDLIREILGHVEVGEGRLYRTLPLAHPEHPWLFASAVEIRGVAQKAGEDTGGTEITDTSLEAGPITDEYWRYARSFWRVQFTPRPYALHPDEWIESREITWTDYDGEERTDTDTREHHRFTDEESDPQIPPQIAYVQKGQMWFQTQDHSAPGGTGEGDSARYAFPGHPGVILPDYSFRVTWHNVPYELFDRDDHPMWKYVGRLNQLTFKGRAPGALLYLGPKATRYTPITPEYTANEQTSSYSSDKHCDIVFHFLGTRREVEKPFQPDNANHICGGHNALPWSTDRKFYYATCTNGETEEDVEGSDAPQFFSFPCELLFHVPGGEAEE